MGSPPLPSGGSSPSGTKSAPPPVPLATAHLVRRLSLRPRPARYNQETPPGSLLPLGPTMTWSSVPVACGGDRAGHSLQPGEHLALPVTCHLARARGPSAGASPPPQPVSLPVVTRHTELVWHGFGPSIA